jgi:hypothetical protein
MGTKVDQIQKPGSNARLFFLAEKPARICVVVEAGSPRAWRSALAALERYASILAAQPFEF